MSYFIHSQQIFFPDQPRAGYLEITDQGRFGRFLTARTVPRGKICEAGELIVAPGLVDTHIHGLLGTDVMQNEWVGINKISQGLLQAGVTSWLPTTITAPNKELLAICQTFARHRGQETGARIQGLHFEGPYFTPQKAGAENPQYMTDPDWEEFCAWRKASANLLSKISLAPDRAGSLAFIKKASAHGVTVSLGHSNCDYACTQKAVQAGASMFTHTFNGMPALTHRQPTLANAALTMDGTFSEIICDGHHVDPTLIKALIKTKGSDQVVLVTDCMQAGAMPDGDYYLGELPVYVQDGMARLKKGNNLAGSILLLKDAVKNLVDWGLASPFTAVKMATWNAAKSVHLQNSCGQIKAGLQADLTFFDPQMQLVATFLGGKKAWIAPGSKV